MAIYKIPDDVLIECKKVLNSYLNNSCIILNKKGNLDVEKSNKKFIKRANKTEKLIKLLEENYGV